MPQANGFAPRIDREWGDLVERYVTEQSLYRLADIINAAVRFGAIYGQIVLPPDLAERKRAAMMQSQPQIGEANG